MGQCLGGRARRQVGNIQQRPEIEINRINWNELEQERTAARRSETEINRLRNELEQERTAARRSGTEINRFPNQMGQLIPSEL